MDKKLRKEIAKEVASEVAKRFSLNAQPGSAFWRFNEILRKKLLDDPDGKIFSDKFADGLARLKQQSDSSRRKWVLISYVSGILLLSLIGGFTIPIAIPYINLNSAGNNPSSGLLEIVVITFLIANFNLSVYVTKSSLYQTLLRTFVGVRYGEEEKDFCLLRWGVDDISGKLHIEKYEEYIRKREFGKFRNTLSLVYFLTVLSLIVTMIVLLVLGIVKSFLNPAFGLFTYLIIGGLLVFFLYTTIRNLTAEWQDIYEYKGEENGSIESN